MVAKQELPKKSNEIEDKKTELTDTQLLEKYLKSEEEIQNFKERSDYKEKIDELRKYNNKIYNKLYELEKKATSNVIEKKYTVKELIKELEKTKKSILPDHIPNKEEVKEIVEEKIATTKEDLKKSFREKIEKKWPIMWTIWTWLFDWVEEMKNEKDKGFFDKIWIKIWTAVLGAFLWKKMMDGYKDKLNDLKNNTLTYDSEKLELKAKWLVQSADQKLTKTKQVVSLPEDKKENVEKLKVKVLKKSGFNILKWFSWVDLKTNSESNNIVEIFESEKQSTIQKILAKCIDSDWKKIDSEIEKLKEKYWRNWKFSWKEIFNTLSVLWNDYVNIIYKQRLNPENLNKMFVKEWKIIKKYKKLFTSSEINALEKWKLNFRDLKVSTISILISLSFSSFMMNWINELWKLWIDAFNYITEDWNLDEELKKELEERKENLIPKEFISLDIATTWKSSLDISITSLENKTEFKKLSKEKQDKIRKLIIFKNDFLEKIHSDEIFNLRINNFKENFENLNLKNLIFLYTLLDWNINIAKDVISKSVYYSWLLNVSDNKSLDNDFHWNIEKELYKIVTDEKDTAILSKEDKNIIIVVLWDVLGIWLWFWEKHISKNLNTISIPLAVELEKIVPKEYSLKIAIALESWLAFWIWFLIRKSFFWKALMLSWAGIPIINFLVVKYWTSTIKEKIWDSMYKELNKYVEWREKEIKVNWENKKVPVDTMEDLEAIKENPAEYIKKQQEVTKMNVTDKWVETIDSKKKIFNLENWEKLWLEYSKEKWLVFEYNWEKFVIDTLWYSILEDKKRVDFIEWKDVLLTTVDLDKVEKEWKIIIWKWENTIEITMNKIIDVLKNWKLKKMKDVKKEDLLNIQDLSSIKKFDINNLSDIEYYTLRKAKIKSTNVNISTWFSKETLKSFLEAWSNLIDWFKSSDLILKKI